MIRNLIFILSVGLFFMSCDREERMRLQAERDSLQHEVETTRLAVETLQEVGTWIDSIDASRNLLRTNLIEGTTYDDYVMRMEDLHYYVKSTEAKIAALESSLKTSRGTASTYSSTIKKLKKDLALKSEELVALQTLVADIRKENDALTLQVRSKDDELIAKTAEIIQKETELAALDAQVKEIITQSRIDQGEAYFARAVAVEETANRTRFAPKKKRETRKEALELYRMALVLGKEEAQPKIAELESKI